MSKSKTRKPRQTKAVSVEVEAKTSMLVKDPDGTRYLVLAGTIGVITRVSNAIGAGDEPFVSGWVHVKWRALLAHGKPTTVIRNPADVEVPAAALKVLTFTGGRAE